MSDHHGTIDDARRTVLKATGGTVAVALAAGCLGDDGDGDDGTGNGAAGIEIDPDEPILLEGITAGWEGLEPASIEGETNPTLVLQEGETYEIGWTQGDGAAHNVVLWDETEDVVEDYYTYDSEADDETSPADAGDFLEFEATSEIAYYRCYPHPGMQGELVVD